MTKLFSRAGTERKPTGTSDKGKPFRVFGTNCGRCGGQGGRAEWMHTGYTCFECGGSGRGPTKSEPLYTAEQLAKLVAAQAKRDAKKAEKRNAELAEQAAKVDRLLQIFFTQCPDVTRWLAENEATSEFAASLRAQLLSKGDLSPAQIEAVRRSIERDAAKATSQFVGAIGMRREFTITVDRVFDFQISRYPLIISYTNVCHDEDGNIIVYRGANFWTVGDRMTVKATVKEHAAYKGAMQTVISRPKILSRQEEAQ
jgi:hypothetical protein